MSAIRCEDSTIVRLAPRRTPRPACRGSSAWPAGRARRAARRAAAACGRLASVSASATWARWPPDSVPTGWSSGIFRPPSRARTDSPSQRGLRCAPMPMWSCAVSRRYSGISWARKPISARYAGILARRAAEHGGPARGRRGEPGQQPQQRGLARAVRPDERGYPALGNADRAVAQRGDPAVPLGQPAGLDRRRRHAMSSSACRLQRDPQQRLDRLVVQPGGARLAHPRRQAAAQPRVRARRRTGRPGRARTCRARHAPRPGPRAPGRGRPSAPCWG